MPLVYIFSRIESGYLNTGWSGGRLWYEDQG
jgi:hypothetical protein